MEITMFAKRPFTSLNSLTSTKNDCIVSFDVRSLFTMVPLDETIEICVQKFISKYENTPAKLFENLLKFVVKGDKGYK